MVRYSLRSSLTLDNLQERIRFFPETVLPSILRQENVILSLTRLVVPLTISSSPNGLGLAPLSLRPSSGEIKRR